MDKLREFLKGWQPIESAPKDGRYFLIWCEQVGCVENESRPVVTRIKDGMYEGLMFFDEPVRWQPIPTEEDFAAIRQMVADMNMMREGLRDMVYIIEGLSLTCPTYNANLSLTQTEKYLPLFEGVKL